MGPNDFDIEDYPVVTAAIDEGGVVVETIVVEMEN